MHLKKARSYRGLLGLAVVACSGGNAESGMPPGGDAGEADSALPDAVFEADVVDLGTLDAPISDARDGGCEFPGAACTPPQDITSEVVCRADRGATCEWPLPRDLVERGDRYNLDRYHCGDEDSVHLFRHADPSECETNGPGWYVVDDPVSPRLGICSDLWQDVVASGDRLFVIRGC